MRRFSLVAIIVVSVLFVPARPAEAQGFWRWLEELSGPRLDGLGFEITGVCWGTPVPEARQAAGETAVWSASPYCLDKRRDRKWLGIGMQFYVLVGDNSMTDDPNDRVDALGFLPTVDFMFSRGVGVGGGVGFRRYATPADTFIKPDVELWVKVRPVAMANDFRDVATQRQSLRDDWLELRFGMVFHPSYAEGLFGTGSRALDAGPSFVFMAGINLIR